MIRIMHEILRGQIVNNSYDLFLNLESRQGWYMARAMGVHGTCSVGSLI